MGDGDAAPNDGAFNVHGLSSLLYNSPQASSSGKFDQRDPVMNVVSLAILPQVGRCACAFSLQNVEMQRSLLTVTART